MEADKIWQATGKRKTSVARVFLKPGTGLILINHKPMKEYFTRKTSQINIRKPLEITNSLDKFDVMVNVKGGGISGQADATKHGIAKALLEYNKELRPILKKAGLITRDSRIKERKKYGQRAARARFQYSKR